MSSRVGQIWSLPIGEGAEFDLPLPCLIVAERVVQVPSKMSEYRSKETVPCIVFDVVVLSSGKRSVWYAHTPLELSFGVSRVT